MTFEGSDENRDDAGKLDFEWHPLKAASNLRKHKISFDEARTVFGDKRHLEIPDREHSENEFRYLAIGNSEKKRTLTLIFTERGTKLRIISARIAAPWERRIYEDADER